MYLSRNVVEHEFNRKIKRMKSKYMIIAKKIYKMPTEKTLRLTIEIIALKPYGMQLTHIYYINNFEKHKFVCFPPFLSDFYTDFSRYKEFYCY